MWLTDVFLYNNGALLHRGIRLSAESVYCWFWSFLGFIDNNWLLTVIYPASDHESYNFCSCFKLFHFRFLCKQYIQANIWLSDFFILNYQYWYCPPKIHCSQSVWRVLPMKQMKTERNRIWTFGAGGLTTEGVDPSGNPLYDRVFHFPPSHTLDTQILETVWIIIQTGLWETDRLLHCCNKLIVMNKTHEATPEWSMIWKKNAAVYKVMMQWCDLSHQVFRITSTDTHRKAESLNESEFTTDVHEGFANYTQKDTESFTFSNTCSSTHTNTHTHTHTHTHTTSVFSV